MLGLIVVFGFIALIVFVAWIMKPDELDDAGCIIYVGVIMLIGLLAKVVLSIIEG